MECHWIRQVVIDKFTLEVKRHGFCDFENDGSFDPSTEDIIEMDFDFIPDITLDVVEQKFEWKPNKTIFEVKI